MTGRADYAVIGAGPAGARGAEAIRQRDPRGRIVVISADPWPFYNRILLSKDFLKTDDVAPEALVLKPAEAWARQSIELWSGARVERLDPAGRTLTLADGRTLEWEKCLIASGSRPRRHPAPGGELPAVRYLRTLDDAIALRAAARSARTAVVVGGGLIGIEVAAALAARGLEVALLAREPWVMGHVAPEAVGRRIGEILARGGVSVWTDTRVAGFEPMGSGVVARLEDGRALEVDLAAAGVGVEYETGFLAGTGLAEPGRGVPTDAGLRTRAEGVWAAGDVALFDDPVLGMPRHCEHWLHAQHQGRRAGWNMTGEAAPYTRVTAYDTELFGVPVTVLGAPEQAESWSGAGDVAVGRRGSRPVAAFAIGGRIPPEVARSIEEGSEAGAGRAPA